MSTPSAQPVSVNLLEHDDSEDSVVNRLITWAITYGRYIMIGTEIIVLLAFISRFSLDRKLTDLREEISQKQLILQANQKFENQFNCTQKRLSDTSNLLNGYTKTGDTLFLIQTLLPQDVFLTSFQFRDNKVTLNAVAGTNESFSRFLSLLTSKKEFTNIQIADIRKNPLKGIEYTINATVIRVATRP